MHRAEGSLQHIDERSATFPPPPPSEQLHEHAVDSRIFTISVDHSLTLDGPPHGDIPSPTCNAFLDPSTGRAARKCRATCGQYLL